MQFYKNLFLWISSKGSTLSHTFSTPHQHEHLHRFRLRCLQWWCDGTCSHPSKSNLKRCFSFACLVVVNNVIWFVQCCHGIIVLKRLLYTNYQKHLDSIDLLFASEDIHDIFALKVLNCFLVSDVWYVVWDDVRLRMHRHSFWLYIVNTLTVIIIIVLSIHFHKI